MTDGSLNSSMPLSHADRVAKPVNAAELINQASSAFAKSLDSAVGAGSISIETAAALIQVYSDTMFQIPDHKKNKGLALPDVPETVADITVRIESAKKTVSGWLEVAETTPISGGINAETANNRRAQAQVERKVMEAAFKAAQDAAGAGRVKSA